MINQGMMIPLLVVDVEGDMLNSISSVKSYVINASNQITLPENAQQ